MINENLSYRIRWGTFICTVLVVLRHSLNNYAFYGTRDFPSWEVSFVENGFIRITDIAVPFFFLVSGYFFFGRKYRLNDGTYSAMLKKKIRTLLIPFVIWNVVGGVVLLMYKRELLGTNIWSLLENFLTSQWYGPLWYVRDIMLMMLLYPVYSWILRKKFRLLFLLILCVLSYFWEPGNSSVLSFEGMFFFLLGGLLTPINIDKSYRKTIACFLVLLWMIVSFCQLYFFRMLILKINILFGLISFWGICQQLTRFDKSKYKELFSFSFLIYVLHFYIEKIMKVTIGHYFYQNDAVAIVAFFLIPILTILIILGLGKVLRKVFGKIYYISTGLR